MPTLLMPLAPQAVDGALDHLALVPGSRRPAWIALDVEPPGHDGVHPGGLSLAEGVQGGVEPEVARRGCGVRRAAPVTLDVAVP